MSDAATYYLVTDIGNYIPKMSRYDRKGSMKNRVAMFRITS